MIPIMKEKINTGRTKQTKQLGRVGAVAGRASNLLESKITKNGEMVGRSGSLILFDNTIISS